MKCRELDKKFNYFVGSESKELIFAITLCVKEQQIKNFKCCKTINVEKSV